MRDQLAIRDACVGLACLVGTGCLSEARALTVDDGPQLSFTLKTEAGVSNVVDGVAWEADADIGFAWAIQPNVDLVASIEARNSLGEIGFAEMARALNSFSGLADGTGGGPLLRIPKLSLRWSFSDRSSIVFGRLHFEDFVSANAVSSSSATAFTNEIFSAKPAIAFPRDAAGVALTLSLTDDLVSRFVVGDADRGGEFDFFETGAVFGAVELEAQFGAGENPGRLRVTTWSRETPHASDFGEIGGVALSADFPVSDAARLMMRYHHADDDAGVLREGFSLAAVWSVGAIGRPADGFGVGAGVLEDSSGASQVTAESFYRWQVTDHVALTPTLQLIVEGEGEQGRFFGIRLRYTD